MTLLCTVLGLLAIHAAASALAIARAIDRAEATPWGPYRNDRGPLRPLPSPPVITTPRRPYRWR